MRPTVSARTLLAHVLVLGSALLAGPAAASDAPRPAVPSAKAAETLLLDVARAGDRIVAVGAWGHVVLSDDGGRSWRQARSVPTRAVLTAVDFVDERLGWAAGHDAVILHTRDGGETWTVQHRDPEADAPLFAIRMEDARNGLAVGAFGTALRTGDGGAHWEPARLLEEGDDVHLNAIFAGPDGTLYVPAEAGRILRRAPGADEWSELSPPYPGSYWGGLATPEGTLLAFGMRGHVVRSEDGGESWVGVDSGTDQSLGGGTVLRDGTIVLVGLGGAVTESRDDGRTFEAHVRENRHGANAVLEGASGLLLFGEGGVETESRAAAPAPSEAGTGDPTAGRRGPATRSAPPAHRP